MKIKANAKINLTLDILDKREDGYHLIDSVFQSVTLGDLVTVEKSDNIKVCCNDNTICDEYNIAYKAAQKFFEFTGIDGGAQIVIEKFIPLAAGLGGGSADAAAVIVALDKLYETNLSENELCKIGLKVGADVPFCIMGGTARVGGIGEQIEKICDMPNCVILLIKYGTKQSTADMYKKIDSCPQKNCYTQTVVDAIDNKDLNTICKNVYNAFSAVCNNDNLIKDIKTTNPLAVSLSGSGPTVFAIYDDKEVATKAYEKLTVMGYSPIITAPATKAIVFD